MKTDPMDDKDMVKRWRLVLGKETHEELNITLTNEETGIDRTLEALYNTERKGGLGASSPNVARWLGDIREYFPASVVKVMQRDALKRLNLTAMLTEPEMLETVVPDIHLVANLMTLGKLIPEKTKATARQVVKKVVDELVRKLSVDAAGHYGHAEPGCQEYAAPAQRNQLERNHP